MALQGENGVLFRDREEAGERLADQLAALKRVQGGLVLGLPRGGVIIGAALSLRLDLPLDVFVSLKLHTPDDPETALGAVTETGHVYVDPAVHGWFSLTRDWLDQEIAREKEEVERRVRLYRGRRLLPPVAARTVIVADDGVATGATMIAALESLRELGASRLIAAVPVGPLAVIATLQGLADDIAVVDAPEAFNAVGAYYDDFSPVEDQAVFEKLESCPSDSGLRRR